jgi:hypothetical protein
MLLNEMITDPTSPYPKLLGQAFERIDLAEIFDEIRIFR